MELKKISHDAIPRAIELAERYRLLNEPEQAASICKDIIETEPANQMALRTLFLALTETFGHRRGATVQEARAAANSMPTEYERDYYGGIACERWGRAKLQEGAHEAMAGDWLRQAMALYEKAETIRETGNDDALLRWNACARLLASDPKLAAREEVHILED